MFKVGNLVRLVKGSTRGGQPLDTFEIIRVLPEEKSVRSYRIKSKADGHERAASDDEMEKL